MVIKKAPLKRGAALDSLLNSFRRHPEAQPEIRAVFVGVHDVLICACDVTPPQARLLQRASLEFPAVGNDKIKFLLLGTHQRHLFEAELSVVGMSYLIHALSLSPEFAPSLAARLLRAWSSSAT